MKVQLATLRRELADASTALDNLYDAVERGILSQDETLAKRVQRAKAKREAILIEMASLSRAQSIPSLRVLPSEVERFGLIGAPGEIIRHLRWLTPQGGRSAAMPPARLSAS